MNLIKLFKQPGETRYYSFDFSLQDEIVGGDTLTGSPVPTVVQSTLSGSGALTLGSPLVSGNTVQLSVSGGVDGERYRLLCTVRTTGGFILQCAGELRVSIGT